MTVKELIEDLQRYDPSMKVYLELDHNGFPTIGEAEFIQRQFENLVYIVGE